MPMTAPTPKPDKALDPPGFANALLGWYDRHHRELPWRIPPAVARSGARPDPYRVWLSEIMLQQTTVQAVKAYFEAFVARWPDVGSLATADTDDVMRAWAGLGYYSRARNLKKCAETVVALHGGKFPESEAALLALPGIGPYTAAAIAAIAFGRPASVVDGNVERVVTRTLAIATPLPEAKPDIRAFVAGQVPERRPGDFAQAMMDLGATICTPRRPACSLCPVNDNCAAFRHGDPQIYPVKARKRTRPLRKGAAFVAMRPDGAILLRKRASSGLLGGMAEAPTTGWTARIDGETGVEAAPFAAAWRKVGSIRHIFTHFELELDVWSAKTGEIAAPPGFWWSAAEEIHGEALPSVMKKVIEAALEGATMKRPRIGASHE